MRNGIGIICITFVKYSWGMKVKEIIKLIEKRGWYLVSQKGSHRQFKHESMVGRVTIAGKLSDEMPKGTANSVLKQAGIK